MSMRDTQKQELLRIIRVEPRSIKDIAEIVGCHYVTASRWIRELEGSNLITPLPFLRGNEKVYRLVVDAGSSGVLLVQAGKDVATLPQLAIAGSSDPYGYAMSCIAYLYRQSMNKARGQGYQGIWTPVDIREQLRECRQRLVNQLQVLEQILLLDEAFAEDGSAHTVMGPMDAAKLASIDEGCKAVDENFKRLHTSNGA